MIHWNWFLSSNQIVTKEDKQKKYTYTNLVRIIAHELIEK